MKLRHSARTDVGRTRDHNEDDYGVGEGAQVESLGHLFVVCDGMGGHAAGEVASRIGVETILSSYYDSDSADRAGVLQKAFEQSNVKIYHEGRGSMGTTGVAALVHQDALIVANVGDSRAYLVRRGTITQISRDHSLVNDQLAAGLITAEQARSLNYRNVITRALGYQPEVTVDLFRWPLETGDIVVLSSDGLHGLMTDEEIGAALTAQPVAVSVEQLVDLANERGGTDNITLVAVQVEELDDPDGGEDDISAATTQPMPIPQVPAVSAAAPKSAPVAGAQAAPRSAAAPAPAAAAAAVAPPPQAAAEGTRRERSLTLPGLILAAILLAVLVGAVLLAPRGAPPPAALPPTLAFPPTIAIPPTATTAAPTAPPPTMAAPAPTPPPATLRAAPPATPPPRAP